MALQTAAQFAAALEPATHVLIVTRAAWHVDGLASALAVQRLAEAHGKRADVAIADFAAPGHLSFIPRLSGVAPKLRDLQRFVISLDVARTQVDEIYYDVSGDRLRIHVTPKDGGRFSPTDLRAEASPYKYDLIVAVDAPDLASLGAPHEQHGEFFTRGPIINIDHDAANERFGHLNLVDITAAATAEIVAGLVKADQAATLDEEMATLLLTGLIAKTRSFRTPATSPRSLDLAAELMTAGASREDIVRRLYRHRDVTTLKLWGRALARLKHDAASGFAWTVLVRPDFIHAGTGEDDLADVASELILNSAETTVAGVLYERPGGEPGVRAIIATDRHVSALDVVRPLEPTGSRELARLSFPGDDMLAVERRVRETVARYVAQHRPPATHAADQL
jgi:nanoRNase/pAp phosphatase (c-di-AMP/oligoRNAs hydrolase)